MYRILQRVIHALLLVSTHINIVIQCSSFWLDKRYFPIKIKFYFYIVVQTNPAISNYEGKSSLKSSLDSQEKPSLSSHFNQVELVSDKYAS